MLGTWGEGTSGISDVLVLLVVGVALLLFSTLTVVVAGGVFEAFFGPGLIRRRINLNDIREVRVVRNPWYCGWGIRWSGRGWLWNVSGLRAVELELRDGCRFRVGSNRPERLAEALRQGCGIRVTSRITGLHQETVLALLEKAGERAASLLDSKLRNLTPKNVEVDEVWSFVYCKQKNVMMNDQELGDQYTFVALDRDSKLVLSYGHWEAELSQRFQTYG